MIIRVQSHLFKSVSILNVCLISAHSTPGHIFLPVSNAKRMRSFIFVLHSCIFGPTLFDPLFSSLVFSWHSCIFQSCIVRFRIFSPTFSNKTFWFCNLYFTGQAFSGPAFSAPLLLLVLPGGCVLNTTLINWSQVYKLWSISSRRASKVGWSR